jgi:chromosome segregation ATPase
VLIQTASVSTSSKKYRSIFNQDNETIPPASAPAPPPDGESTHPDLETQLLDARVALVKYEQELEIKDDQIAQANQEIERLNTRYTDMTDYIESGEPAILMLKESSKKHIEKMNRQRVQIDNLHIHNRRLKSML